MRAIASLTPAEAVVRSRLHGRRVDGPRDGPVTSGSSMRARTGQKGWRKASSYDLRLSIGYYAEPRPERFMAGNNFPPDHEAGTYELHHRGSGIFRYRDKAGRTSRGARPRCARETQEMSKANEMAPVSRGHLSSPPRDGESGLFSRRTRLVADTEPADAGLLQLNSRRSARTSSLLAFDKPGHREIAAVSDDERDGPGNRGHIFRFGHFLRSRAQRAARRVMFRPPYRDTGICRPPVMQFIGPASWSGGKLLTAMNLRAGFRVLTD